MYEDEVVFVLSLLLGNSNIHDDVPCLPAYFGSYNRLQATWHYFTTEEREIISAETRNHLGPHNFKILS